MSHTMESCKGLTWTHDPLTYLFFESWLTFISFIPLTWSPCKLPRKYNIFKSCKNWQNKFLKYGCFSPQLSYDLRKKQFFNIKSCFFVVSFTSECQKCFISFSTEYVGRDAYIFFNWTLEQFTSPVFWESKT